MTGVAIGTLMGPPLGGIIAFYTSLWVPFMCVGGALLVNGSAQCAVLLRYWSTQTIQLYETLSDCEIKISKLE